MTREEAIAVLEKEASIIDDNSIEMTAREWDEFDDFKRDAIPVAIEALSAEAVQGEWIDIDSYYRMATCSHCLKVTMFEKWGEYTRPYNFCPNCGARMNGGEEE